MMRCACALSVLGFAVALSTASPAGAQSSPCTGDVTADGVPRERGPALRMGITPAGEAGAIGSAPLTPIDRRKTLEALARLRPSHAPFVLRLNRFF